MTFENKSQLQTYLSTRNYPKELHDELLQSMEQVRECINGGAYYSALAIAETIEEEQEITAKYNLNDFCPEINENIGYDEVIWNKKIFIFDDAGDGIILYTCQAGAKKSTEFPRSDNSITTPDNIGNFAACADSCQEEENGEPKAKFNKSTRFMTRAIAETFPDELKILIWEIIDEDVNEYSDTDYLQVFTFEKIGQNLITVKREQEEPPRTTVVYIDYKSEYQSILDRKIFVIDDTDHSTMLYAEEY